VLAWGLLLAGLLGGVALVSRLGGGDKPAPSIPAQQAESAAPQPAATSLAGGAAEREPPSPAAATPPAAAQVRLLLRGAPPRTRVKLGARVIGEAPGPLLLDPGAQAIELTLEARGHAPRTVRVVPDRDLEIDATLEKAARPGRRGPLPRDLESPF
jgi:hypothetical protein